MKIKKLLEFIEWKNTGTVWKGRRVVRIPTLNVNIYTCNSKFWTFFWFQIILSKVFRGWLMTVWFCRLIFYLFIFFFYWVPALRIGSCSRYSHFYTILFNSLNESILYKIDWLAKITTKTLAVTSNHIALGLSWFYTGILTPPCQLVS